MKLPRHISGLRAARAFQRLGFKVVRQRGSHLVLRRDEPFAQITVPMHAEIRVGTLHDLLEDAGVPLEEFLAVL